MNQRRAIMKAQRTLLLLVTLAASSPAFAQQGAPAAQPVNAGAQTPASLPDLSGIWRHYSLPWLIAPTSGPGPVLNLARRKEDGQSDYGELVGDYKNPILQPWAAEVVRKKGELSRAHIIYPNPHNQCWPEPMPFVFKSLAMQMLQAPKQLVMLFNQQSEYRFIRMNDTHPAKITPSWRGDAVGHYEGDTLVVDTIGVRTGHPFGMVDLFGTPYTEKLHVVERYRLRDYADVKVLLDRSTKENWKPQGPYPNPANYKDKYLQLDLTIEDEGAFTMPWNAHMVFLRERAEWQESVCQENRFEFPSQENHIPAAERLDF
jgi:hypothetical protein